MPIFFVFICLFFPNRLCYAVISRHIADIFVNKLLAGIFTNISAMRTRPEGSPAASSRSCSAASRCVPDDTSVNTLPAELFIVYSLCGQDPKGLRPLHRGAASQLRDVCRMNTLFSQQQYKMNPRQQTQLNIIRKI
mgnify:CR=1 FL=1